MRTKLHALFIGGAVFTFVLMAACSKRDKSSATSGDSTSPNGSAGGADISLHTFSGDKKLAIQGREIFLQVNCYGCHGGLGGGAMGPSLRDTVWKYGGTDSMIYHSIHDGRPLGMPPWAGRLNDRQIGALIQYIHSLRTNDEPKFFFAASGDTTAMPSANAAPPAVPTPVPAPGARPSGQAGARPPTRR